MTETEILKPNSIRLNNEWLKANWDKYPGDWIALESGFIMGTAPSLRELVNKIGNPIGRNILVTQLPEAPKSSIEGDKMADTEILLSILTALKVIVFLLAFVAAELFGFWVSKDRKRS